MQISWAIKPFNALTIYELYEILELRQRVFVLEQKCAFIDNDYLDVDSYHLMGYDAKGKLVAYARILPPGVDYSEASIGRVVTQPAVRGTGLGKMLMQEAIKELIRLFGKAPVKIKAQYYLLKFYQSFGFMPQGYVFMEDDIEHIEMVMQWDK